MANVEIRQVSKIFGDYRAINEINLTAEDGKFLVLLGPSGCGKTTLLRMIAGLELPTSGDIFIGDTNATRLHPKDRNIAMVFQNYALYPHLTIYENIAFPLRVRRFKGDIDQKVKWAASLVGIEHLLARKPRQMSGGERQRTALARSMVRDPSVFLLDEPLSNLDAKLRNSAREELRQFQERIGMTSIYVTHDQVEAMGLGDRICVMQGGVIRQVGTPQEIYLHPADVFVASFIGSPPMNLVKEDTRTVGFRPETFLPESCFQQGEDLFRVQFTIQRVEYLGGDRILYGLTGSPLPQAKVVARLPATVMLSPEVGSTVGFALRQDDLRYFDADGLALPLTHPRTVRKAANG